MPVRVLRLIEYIYPDEQTMIEDMSVWHVQGTLLPGRGKQIRSTVLPPEYTETMPPARYFEAVETLQAVEYSNGPIVEHIPGEITFVPGRFIDRTLNERKPRGT